MTLSCRGYTKIIDESDEHSWAYSVPPQEPFAGIFTAQLKLNFSLSPLFLYEWSMLQKFRLGKSQQLQTYQDYKQEGN